LPNLLPCCQRHVFNFCQCQRLSPLRQRFFDQPLNLAHDFRFQLLAFCGHHSPHPSTPSSLSPFAPISECTRIESQQAFDDTVGYYTEIGVTDFVIHWPRQQEPFAADLKTFENIISRRLNADEG
jgi:hypothetical protein